MSRSKESIVAAMEETGIIPVFYYSNVNIAKKVIETAYEAGVRVFEFTNRGANAFDVFSQLVDYVKEFSDAVLGIGTILDVPNAEKYIGAGASFIVSPIMKTDMGRACIDHDVMWIPGCGTVTELITAKDEGASVIKVFPASVLGPRFVSAVKQVAPDAKLMPTGGVETSEKNLREWFAAGVTCVGMGSQLITTDIVSRQDWRKLKEEISTVIENIQQIKKTTSKI